MELRDSVSGKNGPATPPKKAPIDRVELKRQWTQQAEERQVEEALDSYARAAMQWMQSGEAAAPEAQESEEVLEARSQQLRLRQKCQDIAAQMLAEELEEGFDGEEE